MAKISKCLLWGAAGNGFCIELWSDGELSVSYVDANYHDLIIAKDDVRVMVDTFRAKGLADE